MIELAGITWDHPRGYAPLEASTERYLKQADVHVNWHRRTLKDFGDVSVEELAVNYDLLIIDHPHMGTVNNSGCLVDLNDYLAESQLALYRAESVGPSFISYNYQGKQYALPIDAACQTAAYRPDLLNHTLLPTTWQDVLGLSDFVKARKQFIATALCPTDCNCIFLTLAAQTGNPVAQNSSELISVKAGIEVLHLIRAIKNASHPDSVNWNPIKLYNHMASSNDIVYSPLAFAYINYTVADCGGKQLKYAHIPGKTHSVLGGAGIAVSSNSKHIAEAATYLQWICHPQYQSTCYVAEGGQPGQLSAWTAKQDNTYSEYFFSPILPTIASAYVRPQVPLWPKFQELVGDLIHEYLVEDGPADIVVRKLNSDYRKIFNG
ncbi:hypothetical protein DJ568_12675 [Mucilaginibacter hurinus]|uniref:Sugar ABC transporter substrate-binding protein n=1 Tax=Mucilaginibacter hurinus TaxID=2201324 RepID=A0A367GMH2_9SPHI|nr:extracellular solute-binding protein [Mucilaginibacter hurinus]RCH54667.1 hypothetical protein DJ568_12675 [Mucilaginibacter hurinus]